MTATLEQAERAAPVDDALEYRAVHVGAVLGLALGAVSSLTLLTTGALYSYALALAPVPLIGLVVSLSAWRAIARAPELYTGQLMAKAGAALSALFLFVGQGYAGYTYATEVPDGYARTSFQAMKPDQVALTNREPIPGDVLEHIKNGDKVFIKGFIRPDSISYTKNIREFLLVRDNNQCCFGDLSQVKFYDQIQVRLSGGKTTDFSRKLFRVGGVLEIGPPNSSAGPDAPLTYRLDADYIR